MKISTNKPSTSTPATQCDHPSSEEILEFTKQMIGGLAPYLSFGVAQHEAWLKAAIIGATPDFERCVRTATRHVHNADPTEEAAAVIHAGMLYVAARKAGIGPADAGWTVEQAMRVCLPELTEPAAEPPKDEPETDY
jgi:hypothetical protein